MLVGRNGGVIFKDKSQTQILYDLECGYNNDWWQIFNGNILTDNNDGNRLLFDVMLVFKIQCDWLSQIHRDATNNVIGVGWYEEQRSLDRDGLSIPLLVVDSNPIINATFKICVILHG